MRGDTENKVLRRYQKAQKAIISKQSPETLRIKQCFLEKLLLTGPAQYTEVFFPWLCLRAIQMARIPKKEEI